MMEFGVVAAILAGLLGAGHCLTMCGAIAAGPRLAPRERCGGCPSWRHTLAPRIAYNAGRIASYVVAGALAGTLGAGLGYSADQLTHLVAAGMPAGLALRAVSAILLILVGLRLMLRWRWLSWPERAALELVRRVAPNLLQRLEAGSSSTGGSPLPHHAGLGLLWGWLPCGQSYSMLLVAAATAKASSGAVLMLAFGIGTLPAMLGVGVAGGLATRLRKAGPMATATGWVMVMLGSAVLASTSAPLLARSAGHVAATPEAALPHPPVGWPGGSPLAGPMCHPPRTTAQR
ncbi:MAG: sulfite exporter TauE/SafE family protein [Pseudomonadota bacterium]